MNEKIKPIFIGFNCVIYMQKYKFSVFYYYIIMQNNIYYTFS